MVYIVNLLDRTILKRLQRVKPILSREHPITTAIWSMTPCPDYRLSVHDNLTDEQQRLAAFLALLCVVHTITLKAQTTLHIQAVIRMHDKVKRRWFI